MVYKKYCFYFLMIRNTWAEPRHGSCDLWSPWAGKLHVVVSCRRIYLDCRVHLGLPSVCHCCQRGGLVLHEVNSLHCHYNPWLSAATCIKCKQNGCISLPSAENKGTIVLAGGSCCIEQAAQFSVVAFSRVFLKYLSVVRVKVAVNNFFKHRWSPFYLKLTW